MAAPTQQAAPGLLDTERGAGGERGSTLCLLVANRSKSCRISGNYLPRFPFPRRNGAVVARCTTPVTATGDCCTRSGRYRLPAPPRPAPAWRGDGALRGAHREPSRRASGSAWEQHRDDQAPCAVLARGGGGRRMLGFVCFQRSKRQDLYPAYSNSTAEGGNPAALPRLTRLKQTNQQLSRSLSNGAPGAFGAGSDAKQERSKARKSANRGAQPRRATHGSFNGKRLYLTPSTTPSAAKTQDGSGTARHGAPARRGGHGQDGGALARLPRGARSWASTGGRQSRDARGESSEQPAFCLLLLLLPSFQTHPKAFKNSPESLRCELPCPLSH